MTKAPAQVNGRDNDRQQTALGRTEGRAQKSEVGRLIRRVSLTPYTQTDSGWVKDVTARGKTIKFSKDSIWVNLHDLGPSNDFLYVRKTVKT